MNVTQALRSVNQVKTSDVEIYQGTMSVFVNQTTTRWRGHVRKVTIIQCFDAVGTQKNCFNEKVLLST